MRIPTLEVEAIGQRIVIRGTVSCYYHKQLVLQGILDVVGQEGLARIDFNLQVEPDYPNAVESLD
jgi:hypothetical protein